MTGMSLAGKGSFGWGATMLTYSMQGVWVGSEGGSPRAQLPEKLLWPLDMKSQLIRKDPDAGKNWGQEKKWTSEDEIVGWHHRLSGHEFAQIPGDGEGQGSLACCSPWGCRVLDRLSDRTAAMFFFFFHSPPGSCVDDCPQISSCQTVYICGQRVALGLERFFLYVCVWPSCVACGIVVPWPVISRELTWTVKV